MQLRLIICQPASSPCGEVVARHLTFSAVEDTPRGAGHSSMSKYTLLSRIQVEPARKRRDDGSMHCAAKKFNQRVHKCATANHSTYYDPMFFGRVIISAQSSWPKHYSCPANRQDSTLPPPQKDQAELPEVFEVNAVHAYARFQTS